MYVAELDRGELVTTPPDDSGRLATYAELAELLSNLGFIAREHRRSRRLSLRVAATEADMSFATLCRVENGEGCDLRTAIAIIRWMDRPGDGSVSR